MLPGNVKRRITAGLCLSVAVIVALRVWGMFAEPPQHLGASQGRLANCPDSPNCVNSQASDPRHAIDPFPLAGDRSRVLHTLRSLLEEMPRTKIVEERGDYLRAECTSRLLGFVDDVEILIDNTAGVIHFRSCSRTGYSDLGVNRRRMETLRRALAAALPVP